MKIFEKFASLLFLFLLIGIVGFMTFVPVPPASEQVILIIIGALVSASTGALPKLFGSEDKEKERLRLENRDLRVRVEKLEAEFTTLKSSYDTVIDMLVNRHVVKGQGIDNS